MSGATTSSRRRRITDDRWAADVDRRVHPRVPDDPGSEADQHLRRHRDVRRCDAGARHTGPYTIRQRPGDHGQGRRGLACPNRLEDAVDRTREPLGERLLRKLNGKLRDELLNGEIFCNLKEAKIVIEQWRRHYNEKRPHSSHGYRPPAPVTFGKIHSLERAPAMQWSLTRLGSRSRSGQRRRAHARRAWVRGGCPSGLIGGAGLHYPSQRGGEQ